MIHETLHMTLLIVGSGVLTVVCSSIMAIWMMRIGVVE